jgi:hypothetical protein
VAKAREVLKSLRTIWGRPVHLQVRLDDEPCLFSVEDAGSEVVKKEKVTGSTAAPAHQIG